MKPVYAVVSSPEDDNFGKKKKKNIDYFFNFM